MWEKIKSFFVGPIVSNHKNIDNNIIVDVSYLGKNFTVYWIGIVEQDLVRYYRWQMFLEDGTNIDYGSRIVNAIWKYNSILSRERESSKIRKEIWALAIKNKNLELKNGTNI